jgi:aspartyl/glutamyl-tRNA(Asn/Gln) amidotransferase C subunit
LKGLAAALEDAINAIKIELTSEEKERLGAELAAFEQWLEPLLAVQTAETEPLLHGHRGSNVFREDEPVVQDPAKLQRAAANFLEGFYRVPSIIE